MVFVLFMDKINARTFTCVKEYCQYRIGSVPTITVILNCLALGKGVVKDPQGEQYKCVVIEIASALVQKI